MTAWLASGAEILVPEIAYYEVRRELRRLNLIGALSELDALPRTMTYLQ